MSKEAYQGNKQIIIIIIIRDHRDRLYVSRKERGRGFASIEDSMDKSIWHLKDYTKKEQRKTDCSN